MDLRYMYITLHDAKKNLHEFLLTYYETNKMTYFEHNIGPIS